MAIDWPDIRDILSEEGAFKDDGTQIRPLNRNDLSKLIEENGGTGDYLELSGLDLSGIDIRGMELGSVLFEGCNLKNALAQPMVTIRGRELSSRDLAYSHFLQEYQTGKMVENREVTPTNLGEAFLLGADLSKAHLQWANLSDAVLAWGNLDGANLFHANLSKSNLKQASLERTDLRFAVLDGSTLENSRILDADLSGASLKGVSLGGVFLSPLTKLDGVQWDDAFISPLELNGDYESAAQQYRQLKEWYDRAGKRDIAGKFHYREREAERKAEWQSIKKGFSSIWRRVRHPMTEV
jgi:uncharacterized protein YjbI with pentapeptide repeats